jgi:hypothetical protein
MGFQNRDDELKLNKTARKVMSNRVVLSLPSEDEIETTIERRIPESALLIEKRIRYKSGIQIKLVQDFRGKIFRLSMDCSNESLWISDQNVGVRN